MKIIVFGNGDKNENTGFQSEAAFIHFIKEGVFAREGKYRYSQRRDADIILLSREGKVYGYFVISNWNDDIQLEDLKNAKNPRRIYLVKESILFQNPVPLVDMGIKGIQFGKFITEDKFENIKKLGGNLIFCQP